MLDKSLGQELTLCTVKISYVGKERIQKHGQRSQQLGQVLLQLLIQFVVSSSAVVQLDIGLKQSKKNTKNKVIIGKSLARF